jgi:molybdenum cofactor biosynthesis enzyme MoaA
MADELKDAGLNRVNISLDSFKEAGSALLPELEIWVR